MGRRGVARPGRAGVGTVPTDLSEGKCPLNRTCDSVRGNSGKFGRDVWKVGYQSAAASAGESPEHCRRLAWQGLCRGLLSSSEFVYAN